MAETGRRAEKQSRRENEEAVVDALMESEREITRTSLWLHVGVKLWEGAMGVEWRVELATPAAVCLPAVSRVPS